MRYIDLTELELPEGWEDAAHSALDEVRRLPAQDRAEAVNGHRKVWADLKGALARLSYGKCWYCEAIQARSDMAVDHYRPKSSVAESDGHRGYWWLAFDWHNYRYCCLFCNSYRKDAVAGETGGKHDHFPLQDEAQRVKDETDDISRERPYLLDPTVSLDPNLIWYGEDGLPVARSDDAWSRRRVELSVQYYNLKHTKLVERRLFLIRSINRLLMAGRILYELREAGDPEGEKGLNDLSLALRKCIGPEAEFSSTARATLMGHRDLPWVEELFTSM